jgi:hypothetical protein
MTRRSGSALLAVTLLGVLILGMGLVLVSFATAKNRESYGLNRRVVCRYAAEGVLQEAMFRVKQEETANAPGWFDQTRGQTDPVLTLRVPLDSGSADSPSVRLSIYDPAEALARFQTVLGATEYIVEAQAALDGFAATLHMRLSYYVDSGSGSGGGTDVRVLWRRNELPPLHGPAPHPGESSLSRFRRQPQAPAHDLQGG